DQPPPAVDAVQPCRRRLAIAGLAAVIVAGVAFAASGAELPLLDSGSGSGGGDQADSDVPKGYVGTWSGPVTRDGEPTGQYRRFVITEGQKGEVVANSISLGLTYECKSDGKLVSAGDSLDLDTKVVKSVPEGKCAALGSHTLTRGPDSTLAWEAAGRTATLHRVREPEKLPKEYLGDWQRPLPGGGIQTVTVEQVTASGAAIGMVSEAPDERCEATADIFSVGTDGGGEDDPVRLAPPAVDEDASSGECRSGGAATLRLEDDGRMVRTFTGTGQEFAYTRED
ncbi:MAG: serine/threonine-protein kinase, partial [Streptomyces sp.]